MLSFTKSTEIASGNPFLIIKLPEKTSYRNGKAPHERLPAQEANYRGQKEPAAKREKGTRAAQKGAAQTRGKAPPDPRDCRAIKRPPGSANPS